MYGFRNPYNTLSNTTETEIIFAMELFGNPFQTSGNPFQTTGNPFQTPIQTQSYSYTDYDCQVRATRRGLPATAYTHFGHPFALEHCEHSCHNYKSLHYQIYQMMKSRGNVSLDEAHRLINKEGWTVDANGNLYRRQYANKSQAPEAQFSDYNADKKPTIIHFNNPMNSMGPTGNIASQFANYKL